MNTRLYRSPDDRVLAGVAGGMAEAYNLDPALVRVGWALLILVTGGVFLVLYIVMALVVPMRPMGMPLWSAAAGPDGAPPIGPDSPPPAGPPGTTPPWAYRPHERRNNNSGAIVIGLLLIIVGGFFLARQFIPALNFGLIWPLVVIVGGALLIMAAVARPRRDS